MKKITVDINEENGDVSVDLSQVLGVMSEADVCGSLLGAYIHVAGMIAISHECGDPNCCVKRYNKEIIGAIEETIKIHQLTHRHA